jgi:integrase
MRQRLTERTVKRREPGEIWDELLPGFGLRIGARKRTYFVMGRVDGRQVRRTVGTTFDLTLAQARDKARAMLANFANGVDPAEAARIARREAARANRNSFAAVAADYMAEHGQSIKSGDELQRKLDRDILPSLGDLPITDIRRADIKTLFMERARETPVAANRMLALIRAVFNFAVDEELVTASPAVRIKSRPEERRCRYLNEAEIASFWNGLPETGTSQGLQRTLKFLLVTGQRSGEVTGLTWTEIDLDKAIWKLPRERTKANRETLVPLTTLAIYLLGEPSDGHVFTNGGHTYSRHAANQVMRNNRETLGLTSKATPHDLRRTFASQLGALQIDRLTITKLLNHAEVGLTGQVYDLHDRFEQKRVAMEAWSARLAEITSGKPAASNVAQLRAAK